jgi:hypothetical protein
VLLRRGICLRDSWPEPNARRPFRLRTYCQIKLDVSHTKSHEENLLRAHRKKNQQTFNTPLRLPRPILTRSPKLHIAFKAHTREHATFTCGANMMASERVRFLQNLLLWERVLVRGTLRIELGGCDGQREDVCGVCGGDGVGLEVLF